ncbi:MAG: Mrp/NBP35 family ATP-binding protein [Candidatus Gastranaerophilales bacterium]|nr:Mrp/NBP35 family ATP-binding protein [Candidatus Gastranaerophilales bacterium]
MLYIHGPSIPTLLGLEGIRAEGEDDLVYPIEYSEGLKVVSIGFMIEDPTDSIIWRGPMKMKFIKQMIANVVWGDLDYLIVDCPPGTGDEPLSVIQTLGNVTGAIIVTTPQKLAIVDVKKSVNFCKKLTTPILGVIENMSGFVCPKCGERVEIFKSGGGETMAKEMDVPFLGKIPLEADIVEAGDTGKPFIYFYSQTQTSKIMEEVINKLVKN